MASVEGFLEGTGVGGLGVPLRYPPAAPLLQRERGDRGPGCPLDRLTLRRSFPFFTET